jgi:hypothetical protein
MTIKYNSGSAAHLLVKQLIKKQKIEEQEN